MAVDLPYPKFLVYSMSPKVQILKHPPKTLNYILASWKPIRLPGYCLFFVFSMHYVFFTGTFVLCAPIIWLFPYTVVLHVSVTVSAMPLQSLQFPTAPVDRFLPYCCLQGKWAEEVGWELRLYSRPPAPIHSCKQVFQSQMCSCVCTVWAFMDPGRHGLWGPGLVWNVHTLPARIHWLTMLTPRKDEFMFTAICIDV